MAFKMKGFSPFTQRDGDYEMSKREKRQHNKNVLKYNKNKAKPLNETQKKKIKEKLNDPNISREDKNLYKKMLNLKKNR
jgi:hypothetical protein